VAGAQSPKDDSMAMFNMTPLSRHTLEAVERKLAKEGFECKIRLVYTATKEAWKKAQRVGTFFSVVKQFGSGASNSFKPSKSATVKANYLFAERRIIAKTNRLVKAYKSRSTWMGVPACVLNVEELATLYHFPAFTIKAPLLKRTEAKKGEPPSSLPMEDDSPAPAPAEPIVEKVEETQYLPDSLKDYDFSNQEFEKKFAKKDSSEEEPVENKNMPPGNLPFVE